MTGTDRVVLDTSVVLAAEEAPPVTSAAISVVTLGELHAGVRLARGREVAERRARALGVVRRSFVALPVDEAVAERYGEVLALARRERRLTKASDLLIIATARATGRTLVTRDERQARLAVAAGVATA